MDNLTRDSATQVSKVGAEVLFVGPREVRGRNEAEIKRYM